MKYCSKCGAELVDEAVVCPKCGCNVAPASTSQPQPQVQNNVKYCSHCGAKVDKEAVVCPQCGCAFHDARYPGRPAPSAYPPNGKMTAAMILGIVSCSLGAISAFAWVIGFFCIGGFVCGIVGLVFQHKYKDGSGKNKAALATGVVGLVLSAIALVVWILYLTGVVYYY